MKIFKKFVSAILLLSVVMQITGAFAETASATGDTSDMKLIAFGDNIKTSEVDSGIKVKFNKKTPTSERVGTSVMYLTSDKGISTKISEISSDDDYSMVVLFSSVQNGWYDSDGYMVVYGKNGNFAVIQTSDGVKNPNKSKILINEKREPLGDSEEISLKLDGDSFALSVNGKDYTFPAVVNDNPLEDITKVYLTYGLFGDGDIKTLSYYKTFEKGGASFVINEIVGNTTSERTLLPLAKTFAFLGSGEKFSPDANLTRAEAIEAFATLYVNKNDVGGTFTSDFTDIQKGDALYGIVAYMQRCEYLPFSGSKLEPSKAITRGELVSMFVETAVSNTADAASISDVSSSDPLYKKICYAVENGLLELDGGKFNASGAVTRGEAAKFICEFVGKKANGETLKTFSDVSSSHQYADYIALAATELKVNEVSYTVNVGESIQDCIDRAIAESKKGPTRAVIELKGGDHFVSAPVVIDGSEYDSDMLELVINNASGEAPVVTGNVDISASLFQKVEGKEYYSYQLPDDCRDEDDLWPKFRNLYLNGEYLNIASSKEYVFEKSNKADPSNESFPYDNYFYLDPECFEGITQRNIRPMELCVNVEWMNKCFRISRYYGFEEGSGLAQVTSVSDEWNDYIGWDGNKRDFAGKTYWLRNHIALLDEPGEFFYDDAEGIIYFYPYNDTDMTNATVSYPVAENLIRLEGASNVTFEGIAFTGTTSNFVTKHGYNGGLGGIYLGNLKETGDRGHIPDAAISGVYTSNIRVVGCVFDSLGGHGVYLDHGNRNVTVKGNSFTDLAMSGVTIGRQYPDWTVESGLIGLIVDNNNIYNVGIDYPLSPGVQVTRVKNLAVTNNTMKHTPYCGVMIGWFMSPVDVTNSRNVEVAYNYCEDNMYAINDGAGIYLPGANAAISTKEIFMRCHHNYIKATGYNKTYNGIYLDANASNWLVESNVIDGFNDVMGPVYSQGVDPNIHYGLYLQTTYNNTIKNNYTTLTDIFVYEWSGGTKKDRNIQLIDNVCVKYSADLPKSALDIVALTGQKDEYSNTIPVKHTEVDVKTSDAHIVLKQNGNPDTAYVTFTVTNNDDRSVNYKVIGTNDISAVAKMVVSTRCLTLKSGETGTITVSFRGADKASVEEVLAEFALLKDNGWRRDFRRVIGITVSDEVESTPVLSEDELLGEDTSPLLPPEQGSETSGTASGSEKKGMSTEVLFAVIAIPVIIIGCVAAVLIGKKKK